jgi:hypothetical protein
VIGVFSPESGEQLAQAVADGCELTYAEFVAHMRAVEIAAAEATSQEQFDELVSQLEQQLVPMIDPRPVSTAAPASSTALPAARGAGSG